MLWVGVRYAIVVIVLADKGVAYVVGGVYVMPL